MGPQHFGGKSKILKMFQIAWNGEKICQNEILEYPPPPSAPPWDTPKMLGQIIKIEMFRIAWNGKNNILKFVHPPPFPLRNPQNCWCKWLKSKFSLLREIASKRKLKPTWAFIAPSPWLIVLIYPYLEARFRLTASAWCELSSSQLVVFVSSY